MDTQEYIIISKTAIQKRIEDLENNYNHYLKINDIKSCEILNHTREELKHILSQSTPLIPEIEKAFEAGIDAELLSVAKINCTVEDYISNLKLDI